MPDIDERVRTPSFGHEGVEFFLIGAGDEPDVEGERPPLDAVEEQELTDLLAAQRRDHPVEPLVEGSWAWSDRAGLAAIGPHG